MDTRLDRIETDVAELKKGLTDTTAQLNRFELATEKRFDRLELRLEPLIAYVMHDELKGKPTGKAAEKTTDARRVRARTTRSTATNGG